MGDRAVAITGLSCRFPGSGDSIQNFWKSICAAAWSKIPRERFNIDAFWASSKTRNSSITLGAHFLKDDVSKFDAPFFSIPKNDASATDPQQRIMLEVAYEALEAAGIPLERISGSKTGVFMGHFTSDYKEMIYRDPDNAPLNSVTGACKTSLANRISWLWDLRGPSFTVDTACSSSLVALHLACQSLLAGDCDTALVGGTSLLLNPDMFMYLSNQGFLSPDGKCKSFDESANGYGRGEGFGCIVLRRIDAAIAVGDPIRAIILATGTNQDGHTQGFTLPSATAQTRLIEETYQKAGLHMGDTDYVEAHGTGTQAGDVAEMDALSRTLAGMERRELLVGSVKSNIGHLEAAAGIASIIKSVLILETGLIPPTINFENGNPKIKFKDYNIRVPTQLTPLARKGMRRVSVNSFGYGGSNAHAVLESANTYLAKLEAERHPLSNPKPKRESESDISPNSTRQQLFVVSAHEKAGLLRVKASLAEYVIKAAIGMENVSGFLARLAYTLSERRSRLQWKTYVIATSTDELLGALGDDADESPSGQVSQAPRIGFIFTGQGAQWPRMGMELMVYHEFRTCIEAADSYLRDKCRCKWSAVDELRKGKFDSQLMLAEFSQTLCTVLQVALVDLLRSWNIFPTAVAGHSSGEIAAAYCLGALKREDAWKIAYYRGLLASDLKTTAPELDGSMLAVGSSRERAGEWISKVTAGKVALACVNSPTSVTISGDTQGIDQLLVMLKEADVFARKLQVDTAYHSYHMRALQGSYLKALSDITPNCLKSDCRMHSSVTGTTINAKELGAMNWVRNLVSPVLFSDAVHDMLRPMGENVRDSVNALDLLVEIGPHAALRGPATQTIKVHGITNVPYYSVLVRNEDSVDTALELAGTLVTQGVPVNVRQVNSDRNEVTTPLTDLPSYPWNHSQRHWHDSRLEREYLSRKASKLSLLGARSPAGGDGDACWRGFLRLSEEPWVADHKMQGSILFPAAGYIALAVEAASQIADGSRPIAEYRLRDIQLTSAAIIIEETDLEIIIQLKPHISGTRGSSSAWKEFSVSSSPDGKSLVKNCSGLLMFEYEPPEDSCVKLEKEYERKSLIDQYIKARELCANEIDPKKLYDHLSSMGLQYGSSFRNVLNVQNHDGKSVGIVQIPSIQTKVPQEGEEPQVIHPAFLDAVFHLAFAAVNDTERDLTTTMVPKFIEEAVISAKIPRKPQTKLRGCATSSSHGLKELNSDIIVLNEEGEHPVIEIKGLLCAEIVTANAVSGIGATSKSLISTLLWKPAIELLSSEEQVQALKGFHGPEKLTEYINLLHHSKPTLSLLEIVPKSEQQVSRLLCSDFNELLTTGTATVAFEDDATIESLKMKDNISHCIDIVQWQARVPSNSSKYDLVLITDLSTGLSAFPELNEVLKLMAADGLICILSSPCRAEKYRNQLREANVDSSMEKGLESAPMQLDCIFGRKTGPLRTPLHDAATNDGAIVLLQHANRSDEAEAVLSDTYDSLIQSGHNVIRRDWGDEMSFANGRTFICLIELEKSILSHVDEQDFSKVQQFLLGAGEILWVTAFSDPSASIIDGLARVVRNEIPSLKIRTLHVADDFGSMYMLGNMIGRAFLSSSDEEEFQIKDNLLHISRIKENNALNEGLLDKLPGAPVKMSRLSLQDISYPTKLSVQSPGMLDSLCLEYDELPSKALPADFIEINVKATAVNFREVMVAMGQIPDSKLGLDAAGIVERVGSAVTKFKAGDRVAMYGHGSHRTVHRSRADYCALIPDSLSFEQAASIPTAHGTAWMALVRLAKVQKGQSVLIHAAAGGVGQAAIQIAKHFEMEIFATVSSQSKRTLLKHEYGISDDHIFNSRDLGFVKGIKRMTQGRGVDVVLNSLSGELLRQTWHCVAAFGYFIEIGLKDIIENTGLDMRPFAQDTTFSFFNLTHIEESRPEVMAEIIKGTFDFQARGITKPIQPLVTYPISDVESAFRLMQTGKHLGKIALTWNQDGVIPVIQPRHHVKLDPDAVYLLAGGLGGLGRSLANKLVDLGARKLCFLSRSGNESSAAKRLIGDLEDSAIRVKAYKCNISNSQELAMAFEQCTAELGSVRGVFQCAMVLRDALFANMTYQQWSESTQPKIQGSWNLHRQFPDVDFFVTLGSFSAIFGNPGQGNYAAAGAFQDALAHHRRALGQRATTIDLGIMRDVGVLAETGITASLREWEIPYGIREAEFLALVEQTIAGAQSESLDPQILTGLATGGSALAAGIKMPFYLNRPRFAIMAKTGLRGHDQESIGSSAAPHVLISQATSLDQAADHALRALVDVVAKMLQTSPTEIDTSRFLHSYGIDSLVAIEIINWAFKELKSVVTVFEALAGVPMHAFARTIAVKSSALQKELAI